MNSPTGRPLRETSHTVSNKGTIDAGYGDFYLMIAFQMPGDSLGFKFICLSQVKDLINDLSNIIYQRWKFSLP